MVRDPAVHLEVIEKVIAYARSIGFAVLGLEFSPIKGPEGNIEYLLHLQKNGSETGQADPKKTVQEAHDTLA